MERFGTVSNELSDYTYQGAAFIPHTMTRDEIHRLRQIAFRKFYLRPSFLFRKLLDLHSVNDIAVVMKSAKSLLWLALTFDLFSRQAKRPDAPR
jgi:hypothetical protein